MKPHTLRYALQLFTLLLLSNAAVIHAFKTQFHTCRFDEIHKRGSQKLPKAELSTKNTIAVENTKQKQYIRIKFSARDLEEKEKFCENVGSKVKDVYETTVECEHDDDILNSDKKPILLQIVRAAIAMHTERLKVEPLQSNLKVPTLTGPLCKMFTVPAGHKNEGVSEADFVLYVASFPSSKEDMFAAGAPCAKIEGGRPVVGALTFTTAHISSSLYSARVAAHEIAHALGFTHAIMRKKFGDKIQSVYMRYKANPVEQVQTPMVMKFPSMQYHCGDPNVIELEDEKGVLSVPSHSHWKRRIALEELMAGIVTTGFYTFLTLALFQDLGFYEADFDKAEEMDFGKWTGCNFFRHRCVEKGYVDNSRYFCTNMYATNLFCAPGRRTMGKCSTISKIDYLPYEYRYFYFKPGHIYYDYYAGEENLLTDRCPIYEEEDDMSCTDESSFAPGMKGADSWCLKKRNSEDADNIEGGICAKVTVEPNGDVYVQTTKNGEPTKCYKSYGPFYAAKSVDENGNSRTFECPTGREVNEYKTVETLFDKSQNENTKIEISAISL